MRFAAEVDSLRFNCHVLDRALDRIISLSRKNKNKTNKNSSFSPDDAAAFHQLIDSLNRLKKKTKKKTGRFVIFKETVSL